MEYVRLGKSNLMVSRIAMGAMNLEKIGNSEEASGLIRFAYNNGVNFFDTSRKCNGSEKTLGDAVYDIRKNVVIATKSDVSSSAELLESVQFSLESFRTSYIDLFQYESNTFIPEKHGTDGIYSAMQNLKNSNIVEHLGFVTEDFDLAVNAVKSGLYETLQFPFSMISPQNTQELLTLCEENDVGFIAMQPLCGGVVENIPLAYGFLNQFENVVPLWGIQTKEELEQILYFSKNKPKIDEKFLKDVENVREFFN